MATHNTPGWTDVKITKLRILWGKGLSTAAIGREINMSKGAVVGKAHRLNLPPRISPLKAAHVSVPRLPRPAPKPYAPSTNAALVAAHIPSIFRENAGRPTLRVQPCCWPLGEPRKPFFHFCGERSEPGKPYCDEHNGIGTVKRVPRHLSTRGLADKYGEPPASR